MVVPFFNVARSGDPKMGFELQKQHEICETIMTFDYSWMGLSREYLGL